jgi:DNA-binding NarL/FixJ family response regulator
MKDDYQDLSILLIEGNELDANLIQRLLLRMSNGSWISTHVSSLEDGIQVYQAYQMLHPDGQNFDLVILTLSLPDSQDLDIVRSFCLIYPDAKVFVFTEADKQAFKAASLHAGAQQFLIKEQVTIQQIEAMVRSTICS